VVVKPNQPYCVAFLLKVTEIFHSIQGESLSIGCPTVFVRLTGCPMRCTYCDTAYAFVGGEKYTQAEVLSKVAAFGTNYVTVTGGEPLAQKACWPLLDAIVNAGYQVSLETGNAVSIKNINPEVSVVLDIKTPGSGEESNNKYKNLECLRSNDQLKFVLCDEADYLWSKDFLRKNSISIPILFSPVWGELDLKDLSVWVLRDRLPVRVQTQLHKVIWGDEPGR
jgi:7-carboxy-7-deazaguanine synthase